MGVEDRANRPALLVSGCDIPENLARFEERLEALIMLVMYA